MWTRRELMVVAAIVSVTLAATAVVYVASQPPASGLLPFSSYRELSDFLTGARSSLQNSRATGGLFSAPVSTAPAMGAPSAGTAPSVPSYSGTNVQVQGVDELDMVKTDGTYLYVASQSEVDIVLAYPATSLQVVHRISLTNGTAPLFGNASYAWAAGLFLDGSHLVVLGEAYYAYPGMYTGAPGIATGTVAPTPSTVLYAGGQMTFALLYDVSDPANPVLLHSAAVSGMTSAGRMVGGTVYLVTTQWIQEINGTYVLPQVCVDGTCSELSVAQIYHDPQSEDSWDYTNILALDVASGASQVMSIVTGGYSVLYMSPTAMYLAFYKWAVNPMPVPMLAVSVQFGDGWTTIYKLQADGLEVRAAASGDVSGSLQSQYAMDEWNGYLRVATTVRSFTENTSTSSSGVYVFDGEMHLVGSVSGIAPGESIFAVRFVEDKAYVVTFRKIDPLFVIDLSHPAAPVVSGYLEMPGFSDYLYPLDAGHLIGVGKDAIPADQGNFSWYQGLKIALYNVTNPTAPTETANVTLGDRGTSSEVLYDPHAFLYIPDRQILVVPVDLAIVNASEYPDGVPQWAWGTLVWQGVYLFHVDATTGFQEIGRLTQENNTLNATCSWYGSPFGIRRSLYIGDTLYTISSAEVMANSLTDLTEISSVVYASSPSPYYGCPAPRPVAAV